MTKVQAELDETKIILVSRLFFPGFVSPTLILVFLNALAFVFNLMCVSPAQHDGVTAGERRKTG